ncbi:hypothetical protein AYI70_g7738 [Smittium culicis]|uniref:NudC domain-containing protein 1 n=1 Tax=Smittium culicis TaxID=133412 RepID=A0A1R1XJ50_9FUNG|nr:hypothetical protein AYI70_g7738 [Smittium culicis]
MNNCEFEELAKIPLPSDIYPDYKSLKHTIKNLIYLSQDSMLAFDGYKTVYILGYRNSKWEFIFSLKLDSLNEYLPLALSTGSASEDTDKSVLYNKESEAFGASTLQQFETSFLVLDAILVNSKIHLLICVLYQHIGVETENIGAKIKVLDTGNKRNKVTDQSLHTLVYNTFIEFSYKESNEHRPNQVTPGMSDDFMFGKRLQLEVLEILRCSSIPKYHFYNSDKANYTLIMEKMPSVVFTKYQNGIKKESSNDVDMDGEPGYTFSPLLSYSWRQNKMQVFVNIKISEGIDMSKLRVELQDGDIKILSETPTESISAEKEGIYKNQETGSNTRNEYPSSGSILVDCKLYTEIDSSSSSCVVNPEHFEVNVVLEKIPGGESNGGVITKRWPHVFEHDDNVLETIDSKEMEYISAAMKKFTTDIDCVNCTKSSVVDKGGKGGADGSNITDCSCNRGSSLLVADTSRKHALSPEADVGAMTYSDGDEVMDGNKNNSGEDNAENRRLKHVKGNSDNVSSSNKSQQQQQQQQQEQMNPVIQHQILGEYDEFTDGNQESRQLFVYVFTAGQLSDSTDWSGGVDVISMDGMELLCASFVVGSEFKGSSESKSIFGRAVEAAGGASVGKIGAEGVDLGHFVVKNDVDGLVFRLSERGLGMAATLSGGGAGIESGYKSNKPSEMFNENQGGSVMGANVVSNEHVSTFNAIGFVLASKTESRFVYVDELNRYVVVAESLKRVFVYRQSNGVTANSAVQNVLELPIPYTSDSNSSSSSESGGVDILGILPMSGGSELGILSSSCVYIYKVI